MNNIKLKYSTKVIVKEKNFRFYSLKNSIVNVSINKSKLQLFANDRYEFLDLHSIKTNRVLIPIVKSFKYHNSKIYLFEVQILYKTKTAEIKKSLINLTDELFCSFNISRNDTQSLYRLIIRYTNFTKFDQIEYYLNNQRIAA